MKTPKSIFQKQIFLYMVIVIIIMISCKKDLTDSTDITESCWKLKSISTNSEKYKAAKEETSRENAYLLIFSNDSIFSLNLSVNYANGGYKIVSNGSIIIYTYQVSSEICCESDFDNKLLETFSLATSYKVINNTLTFKGEKGEIEFKKQ